MTTIDKIIQKIQAESKYGKIKLEAVVEILRANESALTATAALPDDVKTAFENQSVDILDVEKDEDECGWLVTIGVADLTDDLLDEIEADTGFTVDEETSTLVRDDDEGGLRFRLHLTD